MLSRKRILCTTAALSINEVFPRFVAAQTARGVSDKTISTYRSHLRCISRHMDLSTPFSELTQADMDNLIVSMRRSGLAHNSISSYARVSPILDCFNGEILSLCAQQA